MQEDSKEFVVAKDFEQLVTLFYSDIYFLAFDLGQDEGVAKAVAKKVFEIAETHFDDQSNNFTFVEAIFRKMTSYLKSDEAKMQELGLSE